MEIRVIVSFFRLNPSQNINLTFGVFKKQDKFIIPNQVVGDGGSISEVALKLCEQYIDADPEWLECRPITFIEPENETDLYLVYTVGVPSNVSAKGGLEWVSYADVIKNRDAFSEIHLKSLSYCTGV